MKTWAVINAAGAVQWVCTGLLPPAEPGFEAVEVEADFDPIGCSYANGEFTRDRSALAHDEAARLALSRRGSALRASDWTQGADSPLSATIKAAWATYRQSLRDITAQPGWPLDVVWPEPPGNAG